MKSKLYSMQWFNEPENWEIINPETLVIHVPPKTDFWRITHYGFIIDDAPFLYKTQGGEFEAKVKLTGDYKASFDQMGLMIRINHKEWIKAGIEYTNGHQNISCVVTHESSDWSVIELDTPPKYIWIKVIRRYNSLMVYFSFDDFTYKIVRTCYLEDHCPVQIGLMAACPDGDGFETKFESFTVTHLPDLERLEWAKKNLEQ